MLQRQGISNFLAQPEWIEEYISLIEKLPLVIQAGRYGIVHSLVPKGVAWDVFVQKAGQYRDYILWRRNKRYNEIIDGIEAVIAGHTIHKDPVQFGSVMDIDTGAFLKYRDGYDGRLTVIQIGESCVRGGGITPGLML